LDSRNRRFLHVDFAPSFMSANLIRLVPSGWTLRMTVHNRLGLIYCTRWKCRDRPQAAVQLPWVIQKWMRKTRCNAERAAHRCIVSTSAIVEIESGVCPHGQASISRIPRLMVRRASETRLYGFSCAGMEYIVKPVPIPRVQPQLDAAANVIALRGSSRRILNAHAATFPVHPRGGTLLWWSISSGLLNDARDYQWTCAPVTSLNL